MKGLLLKELIVSKAVLRWYAFLFTLFFILGIALKNEGFFFGIGVFMAVSYPSISIAADEKENWIKFALASGCPPVKLAASKYVVPLTLDLAISLATVLALLLIPESTLPWISLPLLFSLTLILVCLMIPVYLRFGVEHGRVVGMVIIVIAMAGAIAAFGTLVNIAFLASSTVWRVLSVLSPLFALAFLAASVVLSAKILRQKEF